MSVIWSGITEEGAVVPVQVTEEGKVVAVGDGPQGDYLPITGGNLTGDLTIDTDKIALNADGFIAASGGLFAGSGDRDDFAIWGSNGSTTEPSFQAINYSGGLVWKSGTSTGTSTTITMGSDGSITAAGSANFDGPVRSGPGNSYDTNVPCSYLQAQGGIYTFRPASNIADPVFAGGLANGTFSPDINVKLNADGSAEFGKNKCGFTSDGELIFFSRGERYKMFISQGVCRGEVYTRQMELKEKAEQFIADKRETKPSDPSDQPGFTSGNDIS